MLSRFCSLPLATLAMLVGVLAYGTGGVVMAEEPTAGLAPWPDNPWYWSYRGEPVLLLGGSDDDNLFQWPAEELTAQLDRLAAAGGNVIRNTMSDRRDRGSEVYPFRQLDDGRYDLERWNSVYWDRLERLLQETQKREIFIQLEIWDRFDYSDHKAQHWQAHPYNPRNNINYSYASSGFAEAYPDHPGRNQQPFFFTVPELQDNSVVLEYQQRFVDRLLQATLAYDHVLYCIDNETSGAEEWSRYWATYIKQRAEAQSKQVMVTEMWDSWDLGSPQHRRTFDHPELYDFVDLSQNNHNRGQTHWDRFLATREYLADQPRPMNTTKTYGADGNKFGHTDRDAVERFWRHLLGGVASARFHRPPAGLGLNDRAVASLKAARKLESRMPFWEIEPANHLLENRAENEAYAAAKPGEAYAVFFPRRGAVTLQVPDGATPLRVKWIDIETGDWSESASLESGDQLQLQPPADSPFVAAITREPRD